VAETPRQYDCIVAGSCVLDILARPVNLDEPIGAGRLHVTGPLTLSGGGITSNAGITMAKLGMRVGIFSYVGDDRWGAIIRELLRDNGVDDAPLLTHPDQPTSTTVVAVDDAGERSFLHCVGAPKTMTAATFLDHVDLFAATGWLLLGYYSLMPNLEADLPAVLARIRATGCRCALDAAGDGGRMQPLDVILPHLDAYVPSLAEARHQTGLDDPQRIIDRYRECGAPGLLGVKLGREGVLLSPQAGVYEPVATVAAPGPVIDTTGAGDSFYAGLLAGLIRGLPLEQAGRLGAAVAACVVTAMGGHAGARDYDATAALAGIA
jgi:sugar/nucleoside kinase (ribokinase family)